MSKEAAVCGARREHLSPVLAQKPRQVLSLLPSHSLCLSCFLGFCAQFYQLPRVLIAGQILLFVLCSVLVLLPFEDSGRHQGVWEA